MRKILLILGASCSGKSSFIHQFLEQLGENANQWAVTGTDSLLFKHVKKLILRGKPELIKAYNELLRFIPEHEIVFSIYTAKLYGPNEHQWRLEIENPKTINDFARAIASEALNFRNVLTQHVIEKLLLLAYHNQDLSKSCPLNAISRAQLYQKKLEKFLANDAPECPNLIFDCVPAQHFNIIKLFNEVLEKYPHTELHVIELHTSLNILQSRQKIRNEYAVNNCAHYEIRKFDTIKNQHSLLENLKPHNILNPSFCFTNDTPKDRNNKIKLLINSLQINANQPNATAQLKPVLQLITHLLAKQRQQFKLPTAHFQQKFITYFIKILKDTLTNLNIHEPNLLEKVSEECSKHQFFYTGLTPNKIKFNDGCKEEFSEIITKSLKPG